MKRPATKQCSKCGEKKPATREFFYTRAAMRDGLVSQCIVCDRARVKSYFAKHPEKRKEQNARRDPEQLRVDAARRRAENPSKVKEQHAQYRSNPENVAKERVATRVWKIRNAARLAEYEFNRYRKDIKASRKAARERMRLIYRKTPNRVKAWLHTRRARLSMVPGRFTEADVLALHAQQGGLCYYCGAEPTTISLDHKIPIVRMDLHPTNDITNLAITCRECNFQKNRKTEREYIAYRLTLHLPINPARLEE